MRYVGLRYVGASGRVFDFERSGLVPLPDGLRSWSLGHQSSNGSVLSLDPEERELTVTCHVLRDASGTMDELADVCGPDLASLAPGRLYDGEWYAECFLTACEPTWRPRGDRAKAKLTFLAPRPLWYRDAVHTWLASEPGADGSGYPHGYPYGMRAGSQPAYVSAAAPGACDVRIAVRGPASSPRVSIAGNSYSVGADVPGGSSLVIDTRALSCALVGADGAATDAVSLAGGGAPGSGSYVFERVEPGIHPVEWDRSFGLTLTVYEWGWCRRWI